MRIASSKRALLTLVSVLVAVAAVANCTRTTPPSQQLSARPLYERVRSAGTIRAGYAVGAPLFVIDPNTKAKSGLFYDIVTTAAGKLGLKVTWTDEVGYGEMIQGLRTGRYDIVGSGVWLNAARGKDADFTTDRKSVV